MTPRPFQRQPRRRLRFAGARHCGERHQRAAEPCCDALWLDPTDGFVIADGAGGSPAVAASAHAALRPAWWALAALGRELQRHPSVATPLLQKRFLQAFLHRRSALPHRDHTLLACRRSGPLLLVAQVGDCSLLLRRDGVWQLPLAPHKGAFANETVFLRPTMAADQLQLWWGPAAGVEALVAFSDGLEAAFLAPAPSDPVADPLAGPPQRPGDVHINTALADLVVEQHQRRRGWPGYPVWLQQSLAAPALAALSDDDRTLVIAAC